jgi:hypothetical protein
MGEDEEAGAAKSIAAPHFILLWDHGTSALTSEE